MRSFPRRGGWFRCRAQWVLFCVFSCGFFQALGFVFPRRETGEKTNAEIGAFMDESNTLCLSMPQSKFDCKPPKALLYTTLRKTANRCRVFAFSSKFLEIFLRHHSNLALPDHFGCDPRHSGGAGG